MRIQVSFLQVGPVEVPPPAYKSEGAVGLDLCAAVDAPVTLAPGERKLLPTGYAVALPDGHEGQVRPRSGLALHHGITVLNSPGTIDPDYRGEIKVVLINLGADPFTVNRGDRIAQLVICPVALADVVLVPALAPTARGAGGYGSTGVRREP